MNFHINSLIAEEQNILELFDLNQTKPSISVIGLGYVGAVSTACLASLGHEVIGADLDHLKVEKISNGISPIHEKDLQNLLQEGVDNDLISATTDVISAVRDTDITFVSVGTPTKNDGGCDSSYILSAANMIGQGLKQKGSYHLVVMRCSVPPGTTLDVMVPEIEKASGLKMGHDFGICFNPEFLREGTAIADFDKPPKTVIGANDERAASMLAKIYWPVDEHVITTTIAAAEMVKYVDNVWHATKVCFANEVGRICKPLNIDSHAVMDIFVQDTKLNLSPYYLKPGFAYGGSCLPKEVRAVAHLGQTLGVNLPLVNSLTETNKQQIETAVNLIKQTGGKKIGFLGLAFKAGTDDLRESPILDVMASLLEDDFDVRAFDPAITKDTSIRSQFNYVRHVCPHLERLIDDLPELLMADCSELLDDCDVVVITQKSSKFQIQVGARLHNKNVIDLVRLFDELPKTPSYEGIGW